MKKKHLYVLVYDCNGKEVVACATPNYTVAQRKKTLYDGLLGRQGKIKKCTKGLDKRA